MNLVERIEDFGKDTVVVPDSVWECEDLLPIDIKVYKIILAYSKLALSLGGKLTKKGQPIVNVSQKTLAERVRTTVKTLQSSLERLVSVGLIEVQRFRTVNKNNNIMLIGDFYGIDTENPGIETKEERPVKIADKSVKPKLLGDDEVTVTKRFDPEKYKNKLRSIGGKTREEQEIIEIAKHYDMLARKVLKTSGYRSLSIKEPQKHKNWPKFEKYRAFCIEKDFDALVFLDVQFERATNHWKGSKFKFPLPHMLCSSGAEKYFVNWVKEQEEKYGKDVRKSKKLKAKKTESLKTQVIRGIVQTCEKMSRHFENVKGKQEREETKVLKITEYWMSYSSAYLYSVPWFRDYLEELLGESNPHPRLLEVKDDFSLYDKNKRIQTVISKTVDMSEKEFGIPANLDLTEYEE
ncbi:hypothetical protein F373_gp166 [Bacillus phage SP-10]|uniref:hypothetical protein n=1 Tax=Bacillus phage SP10 TaxID=941058 RepID=UPI0002198B7A|nr:hypothetical protein F373_gp166 [Bacillus phage SP-10]BAK52978.1 hypothetical protein [Bacillus phage SP-10]